MEKKTNKILKTMTTVKTRIIYSQSRLETIESCVFFYYLSF